MQKPIFPMKCLRVTQGELSTYSHAGSLAMDFGGVDSGVDKLYCPCDMVVKRVRNNANGELYLQSTEPVLFADGTIDYLVMLCMHDNVFNVKQGDIIKQGTYFYDEGGMGSGKAGTFANHVHVECSKGKRTLFNQIKNKQGTWVMSNQCSLYNVFWLNNTTVLNDGGYTWKTIEDEKTIDYKSFYEDVKKLIDKYNI